MKNCFSGKQEASRINETVRPCCPADQESDQTNLAVLDLSAVTSSDPLLTLRLFLSTHEADEHEIPEARLRVTFYRSTNEPLTLPLTLSTQPPESIKS